MAMNSSIERLAERLGIGSGSRKVGRTTLLRLSIYYGNVLFIVVENSLALAFSLAGIVAAVRFRNNLKDSRDAVYIFAAVGIGFASGVGALAIAAFLSVFFCAMELLLWKLDLAADHEHTFGLLCTPAGAPAQRIHLPALQRTAGTTPAAGTDVDSMIPSADTGLLALGGAKPEVRNGDANVAKRPPQRLLVYVTDPEKARRIADAVLEDMTKEYKLTKTTNGGNDQYVLEYRVRTRKKAPGEAIIDRLHAVGMPYVLAAELLPDAPAKS